MTEELTAPTRSGGPYFAAVPPARMHVVYGCILRSIADVVSVLRFSRGEEAPPEYAVASTFVGMPSGRTHDYLSVLTLMHGSEPSHFVHDLTQAVGLERKTGIERRLLAMRRAQLRLGDAPRLVGVTAQLGLQSQSMRMGQYTGIVALCYLGDGHILAAVLGENGAVLHASLLQSTDPDWRVHLVDGPVDLRGDLGFLYSVLTATPNELELLL